jgi:hypothetical protein
MKLLLSLFPALATTLQSPLVRSSLAANATSSDQLLITRRHVVLMALQVDGIFMLSTAITIVHRHLVLLDITISVPVTSANQLL